MQEVERPRSSCSVYSGIGVTDNENVPLFAPDNIQDILNIS